VIAGNLWALSYEVSLRGAVADFIVAASERGYLIRLVSEHHGNVSKAASAAKKERRDLGKLLKRHRIDPESFRVSVRQETGSEHTHSQEILPTSINAESAADSAPKVN